MNQDNIRGLVPESPAPSSPDNDQFFQQSPGQTEIPANPEVPAAPENQVVAPVAETQNTNVVSDSVGLDPADAVSEGNKNIPNRPAICTDPKIIEEALEFYNEEPPDLGRLYRMSAGLYQQKE